MHKIHSTEGLVLAKRGVGEANVRIVLLTEGLGLINASARSSRFEHSKLRYGLEPLTRARFALVRGKAEWRLTGVEQISRDCIGGGSARRQASGRIARLLLRLVQGEEPLVELYRAVREGLLFLAAATSEQDAQAVECVLVLRVLAQLGYLPHTQELAPFIADTFFSVELAAEAAKSRTLLIRTINESLQSTGL
ncbi:MAG TPA: recombination protein O N-terminal domain-containing protein [Candidatus Paceibacterota bacterium]|nr:recombination protein O N-terminal domain-containing protein [Candidatus Paceibacterota bacterium]